MIFPLSALAPTIKWQKSLFPVSFLFFHLKEQCLLNTHAMSYWTSWNCLIFGRHSIFKSMGRSFQKVNRKYIINVPELNINSMGKTNAYWLVYNWSWLWTSTRFSRKTEPIDWMIPTHTLTNTSRDNLGTHGQSTWHIKLIITSPPFITLAAIHVFLDHTWSPNKDNNEVIILPNISDTTILP